MTFMTGTPLTEASEVDFTAQMLYATLAAKGLQCIVAPLHDGPQVATYEVSLQLGVRPRKVERLSDALAAAAGAESCRISRRRGKLLIEIPKPEGERKTLSARRLQSVESPTPWHVPVGLGMTGRPVWLNLADERTCHVALGGTTRSGKTNLLHWILLRLTSQNRRHELQLLLADPKEYELAPFERALHLIHPPATRATEIVQLLVWLQGQAVQRARSGVHDPRILMVIDEVRELVDQASEVKPLLASLAQIGAGLGVNLIVTTQQPGAKALGDALPNFPARLLGRTASKTLSYGASGRARSYAEELLGRGDMLLVVGTKMRRLQAPLVTEADLAEIPRCSGDVPRLDLPEAVALTADVDPRGGWNRKPLDLDAIRLLVEKGATASELVHELTINYERAKRLVARYGGDE